MESLSKTDTALKKIKEVLSGLTIFEIEVILGEIQQQLKEKAIVKFDS